MSSYDSDELADWHVLLKKLAAAQKKAMVHGMYWNSDMIIGPLQSVSPIDPDVGGPVRGVYDA